MRGLAVLAGTALTLLLAGAGDAPAPKEQSLEVPMPPGFRVQSTELEGPVFADARGHTLYMWPSKKMRNGFSGEMKGKPECFGAVRTVTAGLMSPYPAGIELPELKQRKSCTQLWPPALAEADAKPVGKWTILTRKDGTHQWAYDEQPLYTSILDREPGDTLGGSTRHDPYEAAANRVPVAPPPLVPPGFAVATGSRGRMLGTSTGQSVYEFDEDGADKSKCFGDCARDWTPLIAPQSITAKGEWSIVERSAGVRQWAFRHRPLYVHPTDHNLWSQEGSDVPGWHNVYTQRVALPKTFTVQDASMGQVLADSRGRTIYVYNCGDDSEDQLACDGPDDVQVYRLAVCGAGELRRCLTNWPYVPAEANAGGEHGWSVVNIDPDTGRRAAEGKIGMRVWAFRGRPVFTYAKDQKPGEVNGDGTGEWRGFRNGLKAFWLRDDYYEGAM